MRRFLKPNFLKTKTVKIGLGLGVGLGCCAVGLSSRSKSKSAPQQESKPRVDFTDPLLTAESVYHGPKQNQVAVERLGKIIKQVSESGDARGLNLNVPSHLVIWQNLIDKYKKMDYSGANFSVHDHLQATVNLDFLRARFDECKFINADLSNTKEYHNRGFFNCDLSHAHFQYTRMDQAAIAGCNAMNADFSRLLVSRELDFKHTDLTDAKFQSAFLASTNFFMTNLAGTNFENAHAHRIKITNPRDFKSSNWKGMETNFFKVTKDVDFNEAVSWDRCSIKYLTLGLDVSPRQARALAEGGAVWGVNVQNRDQDLETRRKHARQQLKFAGIWNRNLFTIVYDKFVE